MSGFNELNIPGLDERLREAHRTGASMARIIRDEPAFRGATPLEVMLCFMRAFGIGLADVSCIDGWWPDNGKAEVTDENLNLFLRDAIERARA